MSKAQTPKLEVYYSDDYAGLELDDVEFYFGYEETSCRKHKRNCECDDAEWAFIVRKNDKVILKLSASEIEKKTTYASPKFDSAEPYEYLLAGIGIYMLRFMV